MRITIQFLISEKDVEICDYDTVASLKAKIQNAFDIPVDQQTLLFEDRQIDTPSKSLNELGLRDGSTILVKKMHKVSGSVKKAGFSTIAKSPMVKNMFKNPSTIKTIQEMFPGLKEEMEENSALKMLMNSEGMEDEFERFAADDDYMNMQMRNLDINMARLQNLPDGARMMNGMAKDVQNMAIQMPVAELRSGEELAEKNNKAIPGKNTRNSLVEYRNQLLELKNIGFENIHENLEVLRNVDGDLQMAQDVLIKKYENR